MKKFPVSLLRQLLGCMQDGLSIRVKAQKLGISKSSVSLLSQTALSHGLRRKRKFPLGDADENLDQTPEMRFKLCTHKKKSTTT